jgi:hypothetical protein
MGINPTSLPEHIFYLHSHCEIEVSKGGSIK